MSDEQMEFETLKTNEILDGMLDINKSVSDLNKSVNNVHKSILADKKDNHGFKIIDTKSIQDATMRVKEYDSTYIGDISLSTDIYNAQKLGMKLRQLEIDLRGGSVAFESGQFLDSSGKIKINRLSVSPREIIGGAIRTMNDETFFRPVATGLGKVTLESSFKFITLLEIKEPTRMVLEKGIYLASTGNFEFKTTKNLNVGYMLFSDKGVFQTSVLGQGILALELPVHFSELVEHVVTPDNPYRVNGDYVLMWAGNLQRSVTAMGKIFGSMMNGTGLVEEYSGSGKVWTAPTLGYYKNLAKDLQNTGLGGERTEDIEDGSQKGKRQKTWWQKFLIKD